MVIPGVIAIQTKKYTNRTDSRYEIDSIKNQLNHQLDDIDGVGSFIENKHWGCAGPLIIDARIKPHHAPAVTLDPTVLKKTDRLFSSGGSLHGVL